MRWLRCLPLHKFAPPNVAQAQQLRAEFAPIGATWHYSVLENMMGSEGYLMIRSEGDTVLQGRNARVLSRRMHLSTGSTTLSNLIVSQSGDSVLLWSNGNFRPYYNFGCGVGDTIAVYSPVAACSSSINEGRVRVEAIDSMYVNGFYLRRIHTSRVVGSLYRLMGPYVERLGTIEGLLPADTCSADNMPSVGMLRCYYDPTIGQHQMPNAPQCTHTPATTHPYSNAVRIYYSPAHGGIRVEYDPICYPSPSLRIYSSTGALVHTGALSGDMLRLPQCRLGLYIVQFLNNQRPICHEKIVVH